MYFSLSEFLSSAVETSYLLNKIYMPFYKWKMKGMEEFRRIPEIRVLLEELMEKETTDKDIEEKIEQICRIVAGELRDQGISDKEDDFLEAHKAAVLEKLIEIEKDKGHDGQKPVD